MKTWDSSTLASLDRLIEAQARILVSEKTQGVPEFLSNMLQDQEQRFKSRLPTYRSATEAVYNQLVLENRYYLLTEPGVKILDLTEGEKLEFRLNFQPVFVSFEPNLLGRISERVNGESPLFNAVLRVAESKRDMLFQQPRHLNQADFIDNRERLPLTPLATVLAHMTECDFCTQKLHGELPTLSRCLTQFQTKQTHNKTKQTQATAA